MALPTPTVLGPVAGYIPTGYTRYLFVPTVANISSPTVAELSAGTDLTNVIAAVTGFSGANTPVNFPNAGSRWTPMVSGLISAAQSSFTINRDVTGADTALALFTDGSDNTATPTTGYFAILYTGLNSSGKMRLFPIQVTSLTDSTDIATVATTEVQVAITEPPSDRIAIPSV